MLIDATHPEETRVVVLRGNRVEEFDFESANRKQLRGNIYLAKVTRVEPSLQAAYVDYGGNRHGFLAFSEIHPDYYQIPVADRQALLAALAEAGFTRLAGEVHAAIGNAGGDYRAWLRAAAAAYVRFATRDAALMELMFTAKNAAGSSGPRAAAERLFAVIGDLIGQGQQAGRFPPGDPYRLQLLFGATLQGIAALVTSGRIPPEQADALITDAIALFSPGQPAAKP
jgi:Ribonuclease G/E